MRLEVPVDLPATLAGGQAFRWRPEGDAWRGVLGRRVVTWRGAGVTGVPRRALESYLRIEPADAARRRRLALDPVLAPALAAHPGLRLLRQDPWEATVAFLTSANNHVVRIEGIVRRIAERWGEPLEDGHHAFPDAATLARARETDLRAVGLGYRAPFLKATARLAKDLDLLALRGRPLAELREALLAFPGVGPKVADCIALFSLDCDDAFPIDRWVLRAVGDAFFGGREPKPREVEAFAAARWGKDAGLAQQYLFHAVRVAQKAPGTARLMGGTSAAGAWPPT